jgi:hypothetical protein
MRRSRMATRFMRHFYAAAAVSTIRGYACRHQLPQSADRPMLFSVRSEVGNHGLTRNYPPRRRFKVSSCVCGTPVCDGKIQRADDNEV